MIVKLRLLSDFKLFDHFKKDRNKDFNNNMRLMFHLEVLIALYLPNNIKHLGKN